MASNRILYLGVLVLCTTFYFASGIWFSWILLILIVAMPLFSLLLSLPVMLSCRILYELPDTVEQGEAVSMRLHLRAFRWLPLPDVRIRLNLRTRDQEKDLRFLSHLARTEGALALSTGVCGFLEARFIRGWVYEPLGLFCLPLRMPKPKQMAILPPIYQPELLPQLDLLVQQLKPKTGGGYSEHHDHRLYRPGDPVKNIHWKLSVKTDALIVREPLEPIRRRIVLAVHTPKGALQRGAILGKLRYLSAWLLEHGLAHEVVWMDGLQLQCAQVHTQDEAQSVLRAACLVPESSAELPASLPIQADWVCPIGMEGGSFL